MTSVSSSTRGILICLVVLLLSSDSSVATTEYLFHRHKQRSRLPMWVRDPATGKSALEIEMAITPAMQPALVVRGSKTPLWVRAPGPASTGIEMIILKSQVTFNQCAEFQLRQQRLMAGLPVENVSADRVSIWKAGKSGRSAIQHMLDSQYRIKADADLSLYSKKPIWVPDRKTRLSSIDSIIIATRRDLAKVAAINTEYWTQRGYEWDGRMWRKAASPGPGPGGSGPPGRSYGGPSVASVLAPTFLELGINDLKSSYAGRPLIYEEELITSIEVGGALYGYTVYRRIPPGSRPWPLLKQAATSPTARAVGTTILEDIGAFGEGAWGLGRHLLKTPVFDIFGLEDLLAPHKPYDDLRRPRMY